MTFKIQDKLTFIRDVPVFIPCDDGHVEQKLRTKFRVADDEEIPVSLIESPENKQFLRAVVVEFSDVEGTDGQPRPHSPELLEDLISRPYVRQALLRMYFGEVTKVQQGN